MAGDLHRSSRTGLSRECTDRAGTSSHQPDPAHRSSRRLILPRRGFFWGLFFLLFFFTLLLLLFPTPPLACCWQRVGDYQSAWKTLLHNYCTVRVHLKASEERIRPAKCWAANTLTTGRGGGGFKRREGRNEISWIPLLGIKYILTLQFQLLLLCPIESDFNSPGECPGFCPASTKM